MYSTGTCGTQRWKRFVAHRGWEIEHTHCCACSGEASNSWAHPALTQGAHWAPLSSWPPPPGRCEASWSRDPTALSARSFTGTGTQSSLQVGCMGKQGHMPQPGPLPACAGAGSRVQAARCAAGTVHALLRHAVPIRGRCRACRHARRLDRAAVAQEPAAPGAHALQPHSLQVPGWQEGGGGGYKGTLRPLMPALAKSLWLGLPGCCLDAAPAVPSRCGLSDCGCRGRHRVAKPPRQAACPCACSIKLNELTPGLEAKVAPTDCRLRPDQYCLELGQYDQVGAAPPCCYSRLPVCSHTAVPGLGTQGSLLVPPCTGHSAFPPPAAPLSLIP